MRLTSIKLLSFTAAVALALTAHAHAADSVKEDHEFVQKVAVANQFEIESSELALSKSQNENVKNLARDMIADHTKAGDALKSTLQAANIDPTAARAALDEKHTKILEKLKKEDAGKDFDEEYLDVQKDAHKDAVSLFKDYADDGENPALKDFATKTLPTLEAHKAQVKSVEDSM